MQRFAFGSLRFRFEDYLPPEELTLNRDCAQNAPGRGFEQRLVTTICAVKSTGDSQSDG